MYSVLFSVWRRVLPLPVTKLDNTISLCTDGWMNRWTKKWLFFRVFATKKKEAKNAQLYRRSVFPHSDSILTLFRPYLMFKWVNIFVHNMATININRTIHVSHNTSAKRWLNAWKCSQCPFLTDFDLFLGISSLIIRVKVP